MRQYNAALGALRLELAKRLNLIDNSRFDLLWVTDFPLLEWSEEENRFVAKHHPFTSPKHEDLDMLETNPAKVRAKAYDMVLNGNEIGGGSIRIHRRSFGAYVRGAGLHKRAGMEALWLSDGSL